MLKSMLKFQNSMLNSISAVLVVLARIFMFDSCTHKLFTVTDKFKKTQ